MQFLALVEEHQRWVDLVMEVASWVRAHSLTSAVDTKDCAVQTLEVDTKDCDVQTLEVARVRLLARVGQGHAQRC